MSARIFLFVKNLVTRRHTCATEPECARKNRRPELREATSQILVALPCEETASDRPMLRRLNTPQKPRGRLPAGSPITEMVAEEQKTNSPNFSMITKPLPGVNWRLARGVGPLEY